MRPWHMPRLASFLVELEDMTVCERSWSSLLGSISHRRYLSPRSLSPSPARAIIGKEGDDLLTC
jgi:hypothetical protein